MREPGFYWVNQYGKWIVAEWQNTRWWICGCGLDDDWYDDSDFESIDEKRLTHE